MDPILAAIEETQAQLMAARGELRDLRKMAVALEADIKGFEDELRGLNRFATRKGLVNEQTAVTSIGDGQSGDVVPISPDVELSPNPGVELMLMSLSGAVAAVMALHAGPVDRNTIHEDIALAGRDEDVDQVSLALTALKRSGRVERIGRGRWQLVDDASATGS